MRLEIHHFHHPDEATAERLGRIERMLGSIIKNQEHLMSLIDDIKAKIDAANASVQKNTDLDQSILGMLTANTQTIKDLKAALDAAGGDQAKLQDLSTAMDQLIQKSETEAQSKADAVTANTPAATPAAAPAGDVPAAGA